MGLWVVVTIFFVRVNRSDPPSGRISSSQEPGVPWGTLCSQWGVSV